MSLADIKVKIEADAQKEAEKILEDARLKVKEIETVTEGEASKIESFYANRFSTEKPEVFNRREIVANLDVKKILLGAKQDLITEAFGESLRILASFPEEKYLAFCEKLLKQASESGDEKILVSPKEKYLNGEWLKKYNEKHKTSLTLETVQIPMSGGFILRKGDIDTNCSWDMLTTWIKEEIEADVAKRLFSK
ncbi:MULTISPECIES: V-type ATP synthase subunit E [Aminobacterium]|uniref:V-type ATP synthase subunit E n=1 Tax=Aminobacterium TaxID=81466 RepID=UPI00257A189F|nr:MULTISPECIES: V-type ATP synthase subunit E [unclassified Aminobacterium]